MKRILFASSFLFLGLPRQANSQPPDFEGIIRYNMEVKSKLPGITDRNMMTYVGGAGQLTIYISENHYRQSNAICNTYFDPVTMKVYYKFRNLDTLYFMD